MNRANTKEYLNIIQNQSRLEVTSFFNSLPLEEIRSEICALNPSLFYRPRTEDEHSKISEINVGFPIGGKGTQNINSYGWRSLAVFNKTGDPSHLAIRGVNSAFGNEYRTQIKNYRFHKFTPIIDTLPNLLHWKNHFLDKHFYVGFLRIMVLEPGGVVPPHSDMIPEFKGNPKSSAYGILNTFHFSIEEPPPCKFVHNGSTVPFSPGRVFWLNNSYEHFAINYGTEPRFHLLMHCIPKKPFRDFIVMTKRDNMARI